MKKRMSCAPLVMIAVVAMFFSCEEEVPTVHQIEESQGVAKEMGHLKQTKTYSAEVVQHWLALQTAMLYDPASKNASFGLNANRIMAYSGVAAYEAVVPGMPAYQSLSGQLSEMPQMPKTEPGKAYHWPTSANAALAEVSRELFGVFYDAQAAAQLEHELNQAAMLAIDNPEIFTRSVAFGKAVGAKIVEWAATDRPWTSWPVYTIPAWEPGVWNPMNGATTVPNGLAYWGYTRTMVPGSINNTVSPIMPYSEDPASAYYQDMLEVYEVSMHLTLEERIQAKYYDDPASKGYPGGAHYYSVLTQVMEQLNPPLDLAAIGFAKAGMSLFDGTIGSFRAKFTYNTERPIQYINRVFGATDPVAQHWTSYIPNPPYGDFPSNHAVFSSSFAHALTTVFGDNVSFSNSTYAGKEVDLGGGFGIRDLGSRHYSSFYDMVQDIAYSRLFGGIHTRYACEEGMKQGMKTAMNIDAKVSFKK
ncbi:phosphatase PAP2 family protein [Cesiribacter andamanensis]|uniref:PAP2 superfamily protein n=1 Tax=Cesiribacter andamanensis AMV16 TaxID=1279009 RepID=M7N8C7_9BACT|nr:phosphatase PAP2 family protein [Cesiribacter andamanensis]EMR03466.1 PAP2 superfamily protein [Cesiribacter andamanensis AMV16]